MGKIIGTSWEVHQKMEVCGVPWEGHQNIGNMIGTSQKIIGT
jgi:hypothetical protein